MRNQMYINSFSFRSVTFTDSHHAHFVAGVKHNYVTHLIKGIAKLVSEHETIYLNPGDIVYIPRGLKYHSNWYGTPEISYRAYSYLNTPDNIPQPFKLQKISSTPETIELLSEVPLDDAIDFYSVGKFYLFLDHIYKTLEKDGSRTNQKLLKKAMDFIVMNPESPASEIAKACTIGETKLYELFKTANTTPSQFKMNVKLERAVNYLISTDKSIEEISQICGFSSSSYFRKNFYKMYNVTPREMRKNYII